MDNLKKRIQEMVSLIGVSGHEWDVARYVHAALKDHVDHIEQRPNGAIVAVKKGAKPGPRVLITAHMDEVGYIVKGVSPKGFLWFDRVGGAVEGCLPGRRVWVKGTKEAVPGIIGVRAGHLLTPEQRAKPQTPDQSYIDIFCADPQAVAALGIGPGAQIVPDSPYTEMRDGFVCTRAADDRMLCAILVEALLALDPAEFCGEVCAVFNVMEETTIAAAAAAIAYLEPAYGLFLDTIPCGDVPDCNFEKELPIALRSGPVIVLEQQMRDLARYCVSHPRLVQALREDCDAVGIKHQEICLNNARYMTDAVNASYAGKGLAVVTLACPRRYSHSPTEVYHQEDAEATCKLVSAFLRRPVDLNML